MTSFAKNIVFFIVTYKEHFDKSVTYNKLIESFFVSNLSNQISIFIFDNTPQDDVHHYNTINTSVDDKRINLKYFTKRNNIGLAKAYNFLADKATQESYQWIVLLDQDTSLPLNFFEMYYSASADFAVQAPIIFSNDTMISPAKYINYRTSELNNNNLTSALLINNITCINSGLLLNLNYFRSIGGYNENLFLDFCDHDFFDKIRLSDEKELGIIECKLQQDFSSNNHTKEQAKLRYKLFLKDLNTYSKDKNAINLFMRIDLPRLLKLTYQYKSLSFIKYRLFIF